MQWPLAPEMDCLQDLLASLGPTTKDIDAPQLIKLAGSDEGHRLLVQGLRSMVSKLRVAAHVGHAFEVLPVLEFSKVCQRKRSEL